jgi:hypothetical protein
MAYNPSPAAGPERGGESNNYAKGLSRKKKVAHHQQEDI